MRSPKRFREVCVVTSVHPAFDTRIFHRESKTLADAGYKVTLIAQHDRNEVVKGIKIVALHRPRNRFTRVFGLTWRAFGLARKQRASVYHLHDPELIPIGILLKIMTRGKIIYDVHENVTGQILEKTWLPRCLRRPVKNLYALFEQFASRFFDAIVVAAEDIAVRFHRKPVVIVHNYPLLEWTEGCSVFKGSKSAPEVIYIGTLDRSYGIEEIVRAIRYLKSDVHLVMIGVFKDIDFERRIHRLADNRITIESWLRHDKILERLRTADIGLICPLPTPNNIQAAGRSRTLYEYMGAGLPVIASNFPLWREIVEGNNCGICVDPLNPKAIAEAIEYLVTHPEEARKMGQNGRRAVEEKYNWEKEATKLLQLYEQLLSQ